jgi:hypothetical protein
MIMEIASMSDALATMPMVEIRSRHLAASQVGDAITVKRETT